MSEKRHDSLPSMRECPGLRQLPEARRPGRGDHDDEIADAAWLYAWSHEGLRVGGRLTSHIITAG